MCANIADGISPLSAEHTLPQEYLQSCFFIPQSLGCHSPLHTPAAGRAQPDHKSHRLPPPQPGSWPGRSLHSRIRDGSIPKPISNLASLLSGTFRADGTLPDPQRLLHPHHNGTKKKERLLAARGRGADCPIPMGQLMPLRATLLKGSSPWRPSVAAFPQLSTGHPCPQPCPRVAGL